MDLRLKGKRALVTGSTAGIGACIAESLASEGVLVTVHGRHEARGNAVVAAITDAGGQAYLALGDLRTDEGAHHVVSTSKSSMGGIDILINNAGGFEVCDWWSGSPTRWAEVYDANVISRVRLIQACVPDMKKAAWGRVLQISSVSATLGPPLFPDYAAAKAATLNLTVSLARELMGTGITVNTVSPGPVVTRTWEAFAQQIGKRMGWDADLDLIKERLLAGPMKNASGRIGTPEDVAGLVTFLASPLADYISGSNFRVDGGLTLTVN